jgi:23S rRNA pseudouridine2605 synthase
MPISNLPRLNQYLAFQLGISRREADQLISQGKVSINNTTAVLGARYQKDVKVVVNGEKVSGKTIYIYLILNKPIGYVCSRRKQGNTPTIYELLPQKYQTLKPVGRLDKNSSGLILLTNNGKFAHQMTHPSFYKVKIYKIQLNRNLEPLYQQMISDYGVMLDDGLSKLHLEKLSELDRKNWQVTMSEGRNRQIRRTFASLGYTINKLHRIKFGEYSLGDIKPGKHKVINMR